MRNFQPRDTIYIAERTNIFKKNAKISLFALKSKEGLLKLKICAKCPRELSETVMITKVSFAFSTSFVHISINYILGLAKFKNRVEL